MANVCMGGTADEVEPPDGRDGIVKCRIPGNEWAGRPPTAQIGLRAGTIGGERAEVKTGFGVSQLELDSPTTPFSNFGNYIQEEPIGQRAGVTWGFVSTSSTN